MAISTGGGGGGETPMSDINTTPLVDVMLVLLIIFLIAIPIAIQEVERLQIPVQVSEESVNKVENVLLSVTATDEQGLSPFEDGYTGATPNGECRVYWNLTPMTSQELYDRGFRHLEAVVESFGGPENIEAEQVPEVHIRGDINVPWQCVGGAIYQMQAAGYPKVGFISTPIAPTEAS